MCIYVSGVLVSWIELLGVHHNTPSGPLFSLNPHPMVLSSSQSPIVVASDIDLQGGSTQQTMQW